MRRPRLLDLFCGAGGAAMGYHRAGFDVVGVDVVDQPRYPFAFMRLDALELLAQPGLAEVVDVIHASPPCQRWATGTRVPERHPDLITPIRELLIATGLPYVIENVPGAPLVDPVRLCGSAFGLGVRRHRRFESNVELEGSGCRHAEQGTPWGVYGDHAEHDEHYRRSNGTRRGRKAQTLEHGHEVMGIDWMSWDELREAIPPAYTEHIGRRLLEAIR